MKKVIFIFLCILSYSVMGERLNSANSHWPPWRVLDNDGSLSGIDIDILQGLSKSLNLKLTTKGCGWKRCLKHMELGASYVMTGLFKTPEREKYMKFIEPAYRVADNSCFYLNKTRSIELNSYQDLYSITVGVVKKVAYFEEFDKDDKIKKYSATTDKKLFRLLKSHRIDAVIMECATGDVRLNNLNLQDEFKHAKYIHRVIHPVYLTISKRSALLTRATDFSKALQGMIDEGEIKKIMTKHGILELE